MYAGDPNGDGAFETSQVSTNPDDPTSNDESTTPPTSTVGLR